ncbi:MAG: ABC transporter permease [Filifactoraceae bacterium]
MGKCIAVVEVALKNSFVYKLKLLFYALMGIVQFVLYYSLWRFLYKSGSTAEYSQVQIMTYFMLSFVIQSILPRWIAMDIGWLVRSGGILQTFLKPINFHQYYLLNSFGDVIFTLGFMGFPVMILSIFSGNIVFCANPMYFIISLILAYLIAFHLFYIIGLFSFWLTNIWGIFITFEFVYLFCSGAYIPLRLMSEGVVKFLKMLPFRYIVDVPIGFYLESNYDESLLVIQLFWVLGLYLGAKILYNRAVKRLEGFGG